MAENLLDIMAEQRTTKEMRSQDIHDADFEDAYDTMVENAREVRRSVARLVAAARGVYDYLEADEEKVWAELRAALAAFEGEGK